MFISLTYSGNYMQTNSVINYLTNLKTTILYW